MSRVVCSCGNDVYLVLRDPDVSTLTAAGCTQLAARSLTEGTEAVVICCSTCGTMARADGKVADPEGRLSA